MRSGQAWVQEASAVKPIDLLAALAAVSACAPVVVGGPPMPLSPDLQQTARVGAVFMSSDWLRSEDDFAETFSDEVHEELSRCMTGTTPLDVRIHVTELRRADRAIALVDPEAMHTMSGVVEFVDPAQANEVVGRIAVEVATSAGGRLGAVLGDRQMMVSEEFGRALCDQAFGRNPRRPGPHNATRG
jgi:hypothetical protein